MADVTKRLTDLVNAAKAEKKAIQFIAISSMDFTELTGRVPSHGELGAFLAIPLRLGNKTEVRFRKTSPNV